ncbi:TPA: helix-turn-helix transcriptional regulator [Yersinia enterocolitica]|uniref:helix-turn-helix domain-containing protein n=1 Tax=Yersinia enterocolitica TaxID=630 RepID=UPI0005E23DE9|nr:helix-turn-helix transcriptional regulator [Yersinia enterocolitica]ELY5304493.1 helix-turn-helix transcriptional regulator [Yersinia enterocolitica]CQJ09635.1 phage repressor protein [Yersinia enterocolitica]CQQ41457.1 phage repressor protein [Yersinia enterocolitica]HDL7725041.1 helix-turn-helix transcriptional regulator [Yersinia enterocolitica]HEN3286742.1 helix-turn-helix transcriptional regulator [Yersinia enterocolitica]
MSSDLGEKVKAIRKAEGLSQVQFCEATGISISTVKKYETGLLEPGGGTLMKITTHSQFKKYTMWLMTGDAAPEIGQVSPDLSPDGPESTSANQKGLKVG